MYGLGLGLELVLGLGIGLEAGKKLSHEDQQFVDECLARIEELMEQLGLADEENEEEIEKTFEEIIVENFPNMGKEIVNQVLEARRVPYRINPRRNTSRYILIKLSKIKYKENILKAAREKQQIDRKSTRLNSSH